MPDISTHPIPDGPLVDAALDVLRREPLHQHQPFTGDDDLTDVAGPYWWDDAELPPLVFPAPRVPADPALEGR